MSDSIIKQVGKGLGQIVEETAEKAAEHVGEIGSSIITGKELLGNIAPMSDEELAQKKKEDEKKSREEARNIEAELRQVRQLNQQTQQQKINEEKQRQPEVVAAPVEMESDNPNKRKKSRGSAFVQGKRKTHQPDPAAMSQTSEKAGKME